MNWDRGSARLDFTFVLADEDVKQLNALKSVWGEEQFAQAEKERRFAEKNSAEDSGEEEETLSVTPAPVTLPTQVIALAGVSISPAAPTVAAAVVPVVDDDSEEEEVTAADLLEEVNFLDSLISDRAIILTRDGVGAEFTIKDRNIRQLPRAFEDTLRTITPRVEIFESASGELQDSVTSAGIRETENEFLQGIFFYAGLDPLNSEALFIQNDETDKTLEDASEVLDQELRRIWAQT